MEEPGKLQSTGLQRGQTGLSNFTFTFTCAQLPQSCLTLCDPWTVAHQAPLSISAPRQEYWNGLPFSSPGDLPNPEIELVSPALAGRLFTTEPPGKPTVYSKVHKSTATWRGCTHVTMFARQVN